MSGLALAFGPTVGGWLVENVGWQSVFFLNVPIGIVGFITGVRVIRESRSDQARSLDIPGLLLGTAGLFGGTYGLIEANQRGWGDPVIVGALAFGTILLGCFLAWEIYTRTPMMPLGFFRIPAFSAGNVVAFAISFGMFGTFFFMSLYMQVIRGYSALETGVRFLPLTGMIIFAAPNAGRLAQKYGSRWPMTVGLTMAGTGLLLLSRLGVATPFVVFLPVLMLMGIGMGSTMTPMTAAVMHAVGPQRAGLGSATTNTSRELGGIFGVALLGTLLTNRLASSIAPPLAKLGLSVQQQQAIVSSAGHGSVDQRVVATLNPGQAELVQRAFAGSFMDGFHLALLVGAIVLLTAAVIANRWIPSGAPRTEPSESGGQLVAVH